MNDLEEDVIITHLKDIVRTGHNPIEGYGQNRQKAVPVVSEGDLAQAEAIIGFTLPGFLRRVYLEVGNGGFGPGHGLPPLIDHAAPERHQMDFLVADYLGMRSMTQEAIDKVYIDEEEKPVPWPEKLMIICDWGCNIYSCLYCASPDLPVFGMDGNESVTRLIIEAPSLQEWFTTWLRGKDFPRWKDAQQILIADLETKYSKIS